MHSRRSTHEVCQVDGVLYAVGGNDGSSSLNSVEVNLTLVHYIIVSPLDCLLSVSLQRYDSHSNKWLFVTSMATRRSSVGVSVLNCLNLERSISIVKTI